MTQTIEELAKTSREWVEASRKRNFLEGINRLLTELYPDNAHFIYELLQNAEDAHAQEVRFILREDRIEFEHDGKRLFSIQNVEAITSIGFSTKRDDATNIGKFGVGFKAVFAYTDTPEITSGEFHFRIRDMVVPETDGLIKNQPGSRLTRFVLPFNNPKKPKARAVNEIETLLRALNATTLLFLTHIRKIEYLLPDLSLGYIERIPHGGNRFEIRVQHPSEEVTSSAFFLRFDKEVEVEDKEAQEEAHRLKTCRIAVAFGLRQAEPKTDDKIKNSKKAVSEWELVPMNPGRVCIYFPADKETSNLRFHLHAPFASTVARDSVRNCAGNNALLAHLADLLAESMHTIRDQGLLTVQALALLPNNKDNLSAFYQPFMTRLVREFQEQNLVPMKQGGHAAADGIFRGSKALSDLINDDDITYLLGDDYGPPIWAANPPLKNQREDNFLSMLGVEQWEISELVEALGRQNDESLSQWMGGKSDKWHYDLYELLMDFMNAAPKYPSTLAVERRTMIKSLCIIRCADSIYRKGSECFFMTDGIEPDRKFPYVAQCVYSANKEENAKSFEFLKTVGVREVDERAELEYTLKERYSRDAVIKKRFRPDLHDTKRFVDFAEKHPNEINVFQDHYIFKLESGNWGMAHKVYLDEPFLKTGLAVYRQILDEQFTQEALSKDYLKDIIEPERITAFAEKVGAVTKLIYKKVGGDYVNSIDYTIDGLEILLDSHNIDASRLAWKTFVSLEHSNETSDLFRKKERPDGRYKFSYCGDSSIATILKEKAWIPQIIRESTQYVQPRDAIAEKLPKGFEYQTGWRWLDAIEFGKGIEARKEAERLERERQTTEYKRKEEVAKDMGFDSPEEAEEIARLKNENPDEFRRLKESISARKQSTGFPTRPVTNSERRSERFAEQVLNAPDKKYERRERSVRTSSGASDPTTWLREMYTNEADQMFCQICENEMPFRKRDGKHYFEAVELFTGDEALPKEHDTQHLALCPLCAAKYKEFVKRDESKMSELKESISSTDNCEVPITLGEENASIRFVETHIHDLKVILRENQIGQAR